MNHANTQHGYSLVEMLVYTAVVVIAALAAIVTFFSLQTTFERNRVERELSSAATNVLERMVRDVRNAGRIDTGLSLFDTSPGALAVVQYSTDTIRYYMSTGTVAVSENGVEIGPLVPKGVTVESLTFWRYTNAETEAARIALTLSIDSRYASTTKTFYATAVLRDSYD